MKCEDCKNYEPKPKKIGINIEEMCDKLREEGCSGYNCETCPLDYDRRGTVI